MDTSNVTNGSSIEISGLLTKNPKPNVIFLFLLFI